MLRKMLNSFFFFTCYNLIWKVGCCSNCINNLRQTNLTLVFADCAVLNFFNLQNDKHNWKRYLHSYSGLWSEADAKAEIPTAIGSSKMHWKCKPQHVMDFRVHLVLTNLTALSGYTAFLVCMRTIRSLPVSFVMIML